MIKYDSNFHDELDALIDYYEKLRAEKPTMERKHIIMIICSKVLREGLEYIKLPDEYKKEYDFYKSKYPHWTQEQLMARILINW